MAISGPVGLHATGHCAKLMRVERLSRPQPRSSAENYGLLTNGAMLTSDAESFVLFYWRMRLV